MSGFGKKKATKMRAMGTLAGVDVEKKPETEVVSKPKSTFQTLEEELEMLADHGPKSHVFAGVVGHENTTKTGTVMDAFMTGIGKDDKHMMWGLDFDGGAAACRAAHWGNTHQIRCWDP